MMQKINPPLLTKYIYSYNKQTPIYFKNIILLSVEHYVKFLRWIG